MPAEPWFSSAYDDRWRAADSSPKELFRYHNAGLGGFGTGSYIDDVILRDRDMTSGWTGAADGTCEERRFYCQNQHHDVVALITSDGKQVEQTRYTAYGEPFGIETGNIDGYNGLVDSADTGLLSSWIGPPYSYHVSGDMDLDGDLDSTDQMLQNMHVYAYTGGGLTLSCGVGNRKGYCGYEFDEDVREDGITFAHVRNRVYDPWSGRWFIRDPAGYVDGSNLYEYVGDEPVIRRDSDGLCFSCDSVSPFKSDGYSTESESTKCFSMSAIVFSSAPVASVTKSPGDCWGEFNRRINICGNLEDSGSRRICNDAAVTILKSCLHDAVWNPKPANDEDCFQQLYNDLEDCKKRHPAPPKPTSPPGKDTDRRDGCEKGAAAKFAECLSHKK